MRALTIALLLLPTLASAQLTDARLDAARHALRSYDVHGDASTAVVADLTAYLAETEEGPTTRQAKFIRAMAAADLYLLAGYRGESALRARIAEAYGVAEDSLAETITADLRSMEFGVYAQGAREARTALHAFDAGEHPDHPGARQDVAYVAAARVAATSDDPIGHLAALSSPEACTGSCAEIAGILAPTGRAAVAAVQEVFDAMDRLAQMAGAGDPFSAAMAADLPREQEAFRSIELHPPLDLHDLHLAPAGPRGHLVDPDALVVVTPHTVRFGWIPRVVFSEGHAALHAAGSPMLPHLGEIELPATLRPFPNSLAVVAQGLAPLRGARQIAITGTPDAEAHLLTRTILSVQRANLEPELLVGATESGFRGVPLRAVRGTNDSAISVYVRLGGHSLRRLGHSTTLPRVRTDHGLEMDYVTLASSVPENRSTAVRFMGSVPFESVASTVFHVAPRTRPVTLVLP